MINHKVDKFPNLYKTEPYQHQHDLLTEIWDEEYYAIFWEMGSGKSKLLLDNAAMLFMSGKINGLLIVAPKGAYLNWVFNEIPKHLSDDVDYSLGFWASNLRKKEKKEAEDTLDPSDGILDILCINIESFSSKRGRDFAAKFIIRHKVMMCIDESTSIKNYKANRTKAAVTMSKHCDYRRIMTGSPVTQSPLDLYSQCWFLKKGLLGFTAYYPFRNYFAEVTTIRMGTREFPKITGYKNIPELKEKLTEFSSRILKEDCLDLPEKTFSTVYVELTKEQQKAYDDMRTMCVAELSGEVVTVTSALTALVKLQQITCGHCKDESGKVLSIKSGRISAMMDLIQEFSGKAIIWCNFVEDVHQVRDALSEEYGEESVETYYGATNLMDRQVACDRFQNDKECRFFVATSAASKGLTLTACHYNIYYSHSYNLETYLQSQDRTHRIGQVHNVEYISLVARDTIDERIVKALRDKKNVADEVMSNWQELL